MRRDSLLRHQDFRRFWIGETASQLGTFVGNTAVPLLAATVLAATPFEMGLLTSVENVAFLLIGLPAGVWVDRMRRRRLMLRADFARAALFATVPLAWWTGRLTFAQLVVVSLLVSVATVFFDISYQSYLPSLVSRHRLLEGNAKLQGSQSVAQVVGPGIGGALAQFAGAADAVLVTGAGFLASGLQLLRIRTPEPEPERVPGARLWPQIAEGLRFVFGSPPLRAIVACTATGNFALTAFTAVQVLFLTRDAGFTSGEVGLLLTLGALGSVLGAVSAGFCLRRLGLARSIWLVPVLTWWGALLVPLAAAGPRMALAVAGLMLQGFGGVVYNIAQLSYRQAICPDGLLGRMNASVRFVVWGTMPLGGLAGGLLGEAIGVRGTLWAAAAGGFTAVLWVVCSPLLRMRDLPTTFTEGLPSSS